MIDLRSMFRILVALLISLAIVLAGNQGSIHVNGLPLFALCASVGFLLHWAGFIPGYLLQTEHYYDLIGASSYVLTIALVYTLHPLLDARGMLLGWLVLIWALRLGGFLFLRVKQVGKDRRFDEIKTRFWAYLFTWTMGGAWVFITMAAALAAITSSQQQELGLMAAIGFLLWLIGFAIEVIADQQKARFRRDPANKGRFISSGLWAYSRHPNYFGEILLWCGITVIALPVLSGWQYVTLVSPVFVTFLLTRVSGIPLLEAGARERWGSDPEYQNYVASTPVLIPRLKK